MVFWFVAWLAFEQNLLKSATPAPVVPNAIASATDAPQTVLSSTRAPVTTPAPTQSTAWTLRLSRTRLLLLEDQLQIPELQRTPKLRETSGILTSEGAGREDRRWQKQWQVWAAKDEVENSAVVELLRVHIIALDPQE